MTYIEFRDKYNGKYVDVDNYPKDWKWQCFDLAQLYLTECLGLPDYILAGCGNVCNMLYGEKRALLDQYFYEVPTDQMDGGDLIIWEWNHIAIFDSWDGYNCWYFSQNPNPCQVMLVPNDNGIHAFRLRKEEPPKPEVTPNVERDEYKDQLEVKVSKLRVRGTPTLEGTIIGFATEGYYDYFEVAENDGYTWYRIADNQWVAYDEEWETIYPAKEKEKYIQLKVLEEKDGYALVDLGQVYIKE